jgi:hypothetical protein
MPLQQQLRMTNRAIILCLTIGLAAFFTGVLFVGFGSVPDDDKAAPAAATLQRKQDPASAVPHRPNLSETRYVCDDGVLRFFWIDLLREEWIIRQTFAAEGQKEYNCSEILDRNDVDLNSDLIGEVVIRFKENCGTKGNCPLAIYDVSGPAETDGPGGRRILFSKAALNYEVRQSRHFGYQDIQLRFSQGVYGSQLELYKYSGKSYVRSRCFDEEPNGQTSPTDCWEDEE